MISYVLLLLHLLLRQIFYEIKPALLNLVMKEQFSGASTDDAAAHLNNFVELWGSRKKILDQGAADMSILCCNERPRAP